MKPNFSLNINKHFSLNIFLFYLFVFSIFFSGHIGGDAIYNYLTVESFFTDGDFNLANSLSDKNLGELSESFNTIQDNIIELSKEHDKVYSIYGIGNILPGILFYGIGILLLKLLPILPHDYFLVFMFSYQNIFILSLLALVLFKLIRNITKNNKTAFLLSIGFSFSTINITYALKSGFGELFAALVILSSFYFLLCYRNGKKLRFLFLSGLFVGSCLLTKLYLILVFPAFFIFLFLIIPRISLKQHLHNILVFLSGFAIPISIFFMYNFLRFNNILETGYEIYTPDPIVSKQLVLNPMYFISTILNIFISPGKGLLIFNPILFVTIIGLKYLYKSYKNIFIFVISIIIPYFLFFSFNSHWASNGVWGTRYFVPILGILFIPIGFLFEKIDDFKIKKYKNIVLTLIIMGIFVQLPSILMNFSAYERFLEKECPHSYYTRIPLPQYSQIFGGYYQLASGINRSLTGESLNFPLIIADIDDLENLTGRSDETLIKYSRGAIIWKSLEGYDWFDLWWIHVFKAEFTNTFLKIFTVFIILLLIFISFSIFKIILENS